MIDVMSGKISTGAIGNLLEYFRQIRAEGRLKLELNDQVGQIYLEEGTVIHSVWRDLVGKAALRELLTWQEGRFEFEPDVLSPVQSIVPEMASVSAASAGPVTGSGGAAGVTPARETSVMIAESHAAPPAAVASFVPVETQEQEPFAALPATLPEELLRDLELLVKRLMGPIGGIFLDDAAEDLGFEDADVIPTARAQDFVQTMADYFDDDSRRRQFLETSKEFLHRYGLQEHER